jgi:hypothetical protein
MFARLRLTAFLELGINNKGKIIRSKGPIEICCNNNKGCVNTIWLYK